MDVMLRTVLLLFLFFAATFSIAAARTAKGESSQFRIRQLSSRKRTNLRNGSQTPPESPAAAGAGSGGELAAASGDGSHVGLSHLLRCAHPDDKEHLTRHSIHLPNGCTFSNVYTTGASYSREWVSDGVCDLNAFRVFKLLEKEKPDGYAAIMVVANEDTDEGVVYARSKDMDMDRKALEIAWTDQCQHFARQPNAQGELPETLQRRKVEEYSFHAFAVWYDPKQEQAYVFDPDTGISLWGIDFDTWMKTSFVDSMLDKLSAYLFVPPCYALPGDRPDFEDADSFGDEGGVAPQPEDGFPADPIINEADAIARSIAHELVAAAVSKEHGEKAAPRCSNPGISMFLKGSDRGPSHTKYSAELVAEHGLDIDGIPALLFPMLDEDCMYDAPNRNFLVYQWRQLNAMPSRIRLSSTCLFKMYFAER